RSTSGTARKGRNHGLQGGPKFEAEELISPELSDVPTHANAHMHQAPGLHVSCGLLNCRGRVPYPGLTPCRQQPFDDTAFVQTACSVLRFCIAVRSCMGQALLQAREQLRLPEA